MLLLLFKGEATTSWDSRAMDWRRNMRLRITGQTAKGSRGKAAFAKPKLMTDLTMNVKKLFSAIGANIRKIFL